MNIHIVRVNLTNWRKEERERRKIRFLSVLALVAAISVLLAGIIPMFYYGHLMEDQEKRNEFLENQIKNVDKKITEIKELKDIKNDLIQRMNIIEQLQQSRSTIVHYFKEISETVPDGIYITSIQQEEKGSQIDGVADSNSNISNYMVNLEQSEWLKNPKLIIIKRNDDNDNIQFSLVVENTAPESNFIPGNDDMTAVGNK
jgi:type IV pilus assembly protein PilN